MAKLTLTFAALLIIVPVGFYVGTGTSSFTPLIPAVFGVLLGVCGLLALSPKLRMHAMHAAMLIAVLSILGLVGEALGRPGALDAPWTAQLLKLICLMLLVVYLALGVRSFIAARRQRRLGA